MRAWSPKSGYRVLGTSHPLATELRSVSNDQSFPSISQGTGLRYLPLGGTGAPTPRFRLALRTGETDQP